MLRDALQRLLEIGQMHPVEYTTRTHEIQRDLPITVFRRDEVQHSGLIDDTGLVDDVLAQVEGQVRESTCAESGAGM